MNRFSFLWLLLLLPLTAFAQDCATMYDFFQEGVKLEYTSYNKKDKIQAVRTQEVVSISNHGDTLIASITMTAVDKKGKNPYQDTFPMKCYKGSIYMDMRSIIPPTQNRQQTADVQISVSGTDQMFPGDMRVGQTLPDAEMEMSMELGALQLMNSKYFVKNRKVESQESLTTSAGTYTCYKISYDFEYKLLGTRKNHIEYWYSPKVGMVKSVTYDGKGNMDGWEELTKVER